MKLLPSSCDVRPKLDRACRAWIGRGIVVALLALLIRGNQDNVAAAPGEPSADTKPANFRHAETKQYDEQVRPFLTRHCQECHRGEKPKGKLHVDQLTTKFTDAAVREKW